VVNIVIKSGTEKFHGDAFEFVRNGYFDAKPFFATVADNLCTATSLAASSAGRSSSLTSPRDTARSSSSAISTPSIT
jgi:hypothetical protein